MVARYALVFSIGHGNTATVATSTIRGLIEVNSIVENKWDGQWFQSKIVELGNNKQHLEKLVVDRNGNKWDESKGPRSEEVVSKKKSLQAERKSAMTNAEALGKDMEKSLVSESPLLLSVQTPPQSEQPGTSQSPQLQDFISNESKNKTSSMSTLIDTGTKSKSSHGGTEAAALYFQHSVAPAITPGVVSFTEKLLTCMRMIQEEPQQGNEEDEFLFPCDLPGKGKVEVTPASGVWIARQTRDLIIARNTVGKRDPQGMLRQLLQDMVHPNNLKRLNALGRADSGFRAIPEQIVKPAKDFVASHFRDMPEETKKFNKTINNLCNNYRRGTQETVDQNQTKKKNNSKNDDKTNSHPNPKEVQRTLRSSPTKTLLSGLEANSSSKKRGGGANSSNKKDEKLRGSESSSDARAAVRRVVEFPETPQPAHQPQAPQSPAPQSPAPQPPAHHPPAPHHSTQHLPAYHLPSPHYPPAHYPPALYPSPNYLPPNYVPPQNSHNDSNNHSPHFSSQHSGTVPYDPLYQQQWGSFFGTENANTNTTYQQL